MRRQETAAVVLAALAVLLGCDEPLRPTPVDAGVSGEGEGEGEASVGGEGEGEGESICQLPQTRVFEFVADGSEDHIDPVGDAVTPGADLVATWSHVRGDDLVIDLRFSAAPLRERMDVGVGFWRDAPLDIHDCYQPIFSPGQNEELAGRCSAAADLQSIDRWPPSGVGIFDPANDEYFSLDVCTSLFFLPNEPVIRMLIPLRVARGDATVERYNVVVGQGQCALLPNGCEHTWTDPLEPIISRGGSAQNRDQFISVCDAQCL